VTKQVTAQTPVGASSAGNPAKNSDGRSSYRWHWHPDASPRVPKTVCRSSQLASSGGHDGDLRFRCRHAHDRAGRVGPPAGRHLDDDRYAAPKNSLRSATVTDLIAGYDYVRCSAPAAASAIPASRSAIAGRASRPALCGVELISPKTACARARQAAVDACGCSRASTSTHTST
jgi:hypothetical protein